MMDRLRPNSTLEGGVDVPQRLPIKVAVTAVMVAALVGANAYWATSTLKRMEAELSLQRKALVCLALQRQDCHALLMDAAPMPPAPAR